MKEAIEILEEALKGIDKDNNTYTYHGFMLAINCLKRELIPWVETSVTITEDQSTIIYHQDTKTSDSPDTPYKIALTEWIEAKHQAENPYSVFEEWQKVCPRTTEEAEQL